MKNPGSGSMICTVRSIILEKSKWKSVETHLPCKPQPKRNTTFLEEFQELVSPLEVEEWNRMTDSTFLSNFVWPMSRKLTGLGKWWWINMSLAKLWLRLNYNTYAISLLEQINTSLGTWDAATDLEIFFLLSISSFLSIGINRWSFQGKTCNTLSLSCLKSIINSNL